MAADIERKVGHNLLPVCFLLVAFSFIDRTNLAFASISMNHDLQFNDATYGLGSGIFFLGYALCQVPSNMVLVRVGASTWLATLAVLWGVCAASFALVRTKLDFILLRFLLGVLEAGAIPGLWYYLSLFYPPDRLTFPYTIMETGITVSQIMGAPLAAGLLAMDGLGGLRGWQWVFVAEGIPTIALGVYMKLTLPDSPAHATFLCAAERETLLGSCRHAASSPHAAAEGSPARGGGGAGGGGPRNPRPAFSPALLWDAVRRWRVWYAGGWRVLHDMAGYGVLFWTPVLVQAMLTSTFAGPKSAQGSATNSGTGGAAGVLPVLLTAVPFAAASLFHLVNAWHSQSRGERRLHIVLPWAAAGGALLALPGAAAAAAALGFVLLTLVHIGVNGANGIQTAWVASLVPPGPTRAVSMSLYNTIGGLGGFLGPFVVGVLSQSTGQYTAAMVLLGFLLLAAAAMVQLFPDANGDSQPPRKYERIESGLQYQRLRAGQPGSGRASDHE